MSLPRLRLDWFRIQHQLSQIWGQLESGMALRSVPELGISGVLLGERGRLSGCALGAHIHLVHCTPIFSLMVPDLHQVCLPSNAAMSTSLCGMSECLRAMMCIWLRSFKLQSSLTGQASQELFLGSDPAQPVQDEVEVACFDKLPKTSANPDPRS